MVYPQPATNHFVVELPNVAEQGKYTITILDLSGNEVRRESFSGYSTVIDRGNLKAGLYIAHITAEKTGLEFSAKLALK